MTDQQKAEVVFTDAKIEKVVRQTKRVSIYFNGGAGRFNPAVLAAMWNPGGMTLDHCGDAYECDCCFDTSIHLDECRL